MPLCGGTTYGINQPELMRPEQGSLHGYQVKAPREYPTFEETWRRGQHCGPWCQKCRTQEEASGQHSSVAMSKTFHDGNEAKAKDAYRH